MPCAGTVRSRGRNGRRCFGSEDDGRQALWLTTGAGPWPPPLCAVHEEPSLATPAYRRKLVQARRLGAETVLDGFSQVREQIWRGGVSHPFVTD